MTESPRTIDEVVAQRVGRFRRQRGWSVGRLAKECQALGLDRLTEDSLRNIERKPSGGRRRRPVDVDELFALADVLQVHPLVLLLPIGEGEEVVMAGRAVSVGRAVDWISAATPFGLDGPAKNAEWLAIEGLRHGTRFD